VDAPDRLEYAVRHHRSTYGVVVREGIRMTIYWFLLVWMIFILGLVCYFLWEDL
jgi:uncharacterized BrkB/YihY/UPF0761 family membrane protein